MVPPSTNVNSSITRYISSTTSFHSPKILLLQSILMIFEHFPLFQKPSLCRSRCLNISPATAIYRLFLDAPNSCKRDSWRASWRCVSLAPRRVIIGYNEYRSHKEPSRLLRPRFLWTLACYTPSYSESYPAQEGHCKTTSTASNAVLLSRNACFGRHILQHVL